VTAWKVSDSAELYQIDAWGGDYFRVDDRGRVIVHPKGPDGPHCDLFELVHRLQRQGISSPVLLRFDDIIRDRVDKVQSAFAEAIREAGYQGDYRLAYPVKVNPQYHVVETVRGAGVRSPLAVEVGSKPELLGVMAIHDHPDALLICNGYKDSEYLEQAMLAAKLGRRVIVVIEQLDEVDLVLRLYERLRVDLTLGVRMKPTSRGAGRWDESAGERAKFGLTSSEIIRIVQQLEAAGKRDWLQLLHYHVGSQITSIRAITRVLREATRVYTELAKLCPSMCMFNAGGGLGVDYDGSRTSFHSSINYTIEEYASEVVYELAQRCGEADVPHPCIITESGRAIVAHHAVLVVEATDMLRGLSPSNGVAEIPAWRSVARRTRERGTHPETAHRAASRPGRRAQAAGRRIETTGARAPRRLLLQFLRLPVDPRLLGHRSTVPDHADPPASRRADAKRGTGRPDLRQRREGGPLH